MITAIIPAKNEEGRIYKLLENLLVIELIDNLLVVVNGSSDRTRDVVKKYKQNKIGILNFYPSLGIDVPRAIGAACALKTDTSFFLFADGDLTGSFSNDIRKMIVDSMREKLDLALNNCYSFRPYGNSLALKMLAFRKYLNKEIGLFTQIATASPSHGPHLVSRRYLENIPLRELAVPPVGMALAQRKGLKIAVAGEISHHRLGSTIKDVKHSYLVTETLIGDSIEALEVFRGTPRTRTIGKRTYLGYHPERRFDLLDKVIKNPPEFPAGGEIFL